MFGIDTLSFGKLTKLSEMDFKLIVDEIFIKIDLFTTLEVKKEILHRHKKFQHYLDYLTIKPAINNNLSLYLSQGFDLADATLLEYSQITDIIIITEDNDMLLEGISERRNIIQLIDFLVRLFELEFLTKREMYHLIKYFKNLKNITKRKGKKLLKSI